jgi:hypothetical protein
MRTLCTSGKAITVTSIRAAHPSGGMKVVDWGIRSRYPGDRYTNSDNGGAFPGLVTQFRGFSPRTPVAAHCGDQQRVDEVDVALSMSSSRGAMTGLWVYYDGRRTFSQYAFALCTSKTCPLPPTSSN